MVSKMNKLFLILLLTTNCYAQNWKQAEALLEESNQLTIAMVKLEKETSDYIKYLEEIEIYTDLEREEEGLQNTLDDDCYKRCLANTVDKYERKWSCPLREERIERYTGKIKELKEKIAIQEEELGYTYIKLKPGIAEPWRRKKI
jgi:NurA-like 5'-3' nuclease